jgi:hypothetical protein
MAVNGPRAATAGCGQPSLCEARLVAGSRRSARVVSGRSQIVGAGGDRTRRALLTAPHSDQADGRCRSRAPPGAIEVPLVGGNITNGVVRVGDTVRRPRCDSSPFIEQLLRHLHAVGFEGAPRWLGVDEEGHDTFSYLPGRVAAVDEELSDPQVVAAGTLLRAFHDATRGSALAGDQETVCHEDAGPYNMVFGERGLPYALIDFDLATPGDALDDVGYAGWLCCINSSWLQAVPLAEQARRLRLFTDSYGLERQRRRQLLDAVISHQLASVRWANQCLAQADHGGGIRDHAARTLVGCKREHAFMLANREAFERALR